MKKYVSESLDEFYNYGPQREEQEEREEKEIEVDPDIKVKPGKLSPPSPLRRDRPSHFPRPKASTATGEKSIMNKIYSDKKLFNKIKRLYK